MMSLDALHNLFSLPAAIYNIEIREGESRGLVKSRSSTLRDMFEIQRHPQLGKGLSQTPQPQYGRKILMKTI